MKPVILIVLVGICLILAMGGAVWWFRRKPSTEVRQHGGKEVEVDGDFWGDFPAAKSSPVPLAYGPYFPLESKGIDKVVAFDDVLGDSEMAYIRALAGGPNKRVVLRKSANDWVKALEGRLATLLQKDPASLEPLRVCRQDPADEVSPHIDVLEDGGGRQGQRLSTLHVFLNTLPPLEDGGRTIFNTLDAGLKPKAGTAIGWNNVLLDGNGRGQRDQIDHEMWHMSQALTLEKSAKYTLVVYSRERP
jgi:hypothetical protein